ncbi:zinc finger BED domain-containing protein DAYSLEEPER [Arabidopsis lyrata subsp. lyrata]|uniref:zinc finger BED domain-containing protein DAYSLEEPER n=1 Tax=Arabidopsis lyrata subsp. lyrata TaxID=81972 RepID=UPI000A29EA7D|nr:zinc finger BED domain-containing protein DAYSLEEPER [Arabidopsis lyrata subsp. lyrata]|eukprot:XP_020869728.1 zinc finger BED domain-containing protein DAYSLEEPER [Arabidopsis lyrata subsp. lyrata]
MEWNVNNAFKTYKELEPKAMMDMTLVPHSDPIDIGLGSSDKSNSVPPKRKKTMTSVYLKYFETAPDSKTRKCKFCGQSYSIATATGNLGRHLTNRHPGYDNSTDVVTSSSVPQTPPVVVKPSQSQSKAPQLDYDHLNWLVLKWLALSSLPPSTVDETWLGNSFKFLNPSIQLWPAKKYKAILHEVFRSMRGDVKTSMEHIQSKVSVTLSFWNSYENIFYMSVTGQWIDENWSSHRLLLDICRIPYPSGGSEIHNSLLKVLKIYAIEDRVLSCTHDNSQNWLRLVQASKSLDSVIRKNEDVLENRMMLSSVEKNAVTIVHNYLDLDSFHRTTNDMCTNKDLTVGLALLFMDNISEMITTCQKSCHNPDWLRSCAESMAQKARSYNTQVCNVFTYITAILDPRIKTEYIPETINLESYIDEARNHFIRNYSSTHFTSSMSSGYRPQEIDEGGAGGGGNISFAEEIARRKRRGSMSNNVVDELTQYLSESIAPMQTDVLDWWKVNSGRYPRLSNMARDFLAVQATSAAPEEIFCGKGEEIDKQRYCMPHDSTQSVICIRSWIEAGMKLKYKCSEIDYERLMELAANVAADNSAGGLEKSQHR